MENTTVITAGIQVLREAGAEVLTIGHGRDAAARNLALAFGEAWEAGCGQILAIVDWPEEAASWLRQAQRFAAGPPDVWLVVSPALGWEQMRRRLLASTVWDPDRTFSMASGSSARPVLSGPERPGMRGASACPVVAAGGPRVRRSRSAPPGRS